MSYTSRVHGPVIFLMELGQFNCNLTSLTWDNACMDEKNNIKKCWFDGFDLKNYILV